MGTTAASADVDRSIGERCDEVAAANVLARSSVPGDVAFLEMGGDSFQAMQILVLVRERLGVDMTVADFFTLPTVASQAQFLEARTQGGMGGSQSR